MWTWIQVWKMRDIQIFKNKFRINKNKQESSEALPQDC